MKHTECDWRVSELSAGFIQIKDNLNRVVARVAAPAAYCAEGEANAKLIAAAPDMLEALIEIAEVAAFAPQDTLILQITKDAIKKATE